MTSFQPPFCPNADCVFHAPSPTWHCIRWGSYRRTCPRVRTIQRYRCTACGRTFSPQTFRTTYWLRRPELLASIFDRLVGGSGLRQIARALRVSPTTVLTHTQRLGRHGLLFWERHRPKDGPREDTVLDGFESFAFSQYFPLHLNLLVGSDSHFVYAFTEAELRRKGRMTRAQKARRQEQEQLLGRPDPKELQKSVRTLLALVCPAGGRLGLLSDDHPAYPRAIASLPDRQLVHRVTSSRAARVPSNPLFPVNRQDQMLRHSSANHRRETIAFSKLRQGVIERAAIQLVWMNFCKSFSEKRRDETPAERLGLFDHKLSTRELLRRRLFPSRMKLSGLWQRYYDRHVLTRRIPNARRHTLRYAY